MITVQDLAIRIGGFSLGGISFEIPTGEYAVLMGKTGSGKTTILEAICGLKPVTSGKILLDGRDVTTLKPSVRGIGFVPQEGALFTTMTVREHLGFALMIRRAPRRRIQQRIEDLSSLLGLGSLLDRIPHGLSGGERQRVALGRALSAQPGFLCLDEPLSALDEETREEMYTLLKTVQRETGVTTLHISHNREEASRLADRTLYLKEETIKMEYPERQPEGNSLTALKE